MTDGPLLVFGPRSTTYDFGPRHPLTPRRFGPGIDLLRTVGAVPGLAPQPADDPELFDVHAAHYIAAVRRLSAEPNGRPEAGFAAYGDDPPFAGMHEAAASVAGGSLQAMEAILRGEAEHAFHPGGGLHHAMPDRASGFCIYNDPALAIAAARRAGRRVMYIDLDVHHGDGVQAIHYDDPGVLTISIHESGRTLFPGTGSIGELGDGAAAGSAINLPLEAETGGSAWLVGVRGLIPQLAAYFGPDLIVSQHGADSHAWDPLAHLRVTTTAMGEAARLVDEVAHRHARGRWLATGGGGYDVYRVVPRTWTLTWLAGAHREAPESTDPAWRSRWAADALHYDQSPPPERFADLPNAGMALADYQRLAEARSLETLAEVRSLVLPRLLIVAEERGWWDPMAPVSPSGDPAPEATRTPTIIPELDADLLDRLEMAQRVMPPADPAGARQLLQAAMLEGARVSGAVAGNQLVGVTIAAPGQESELAPELLWVGVAPEQRRQGLATALVAAIADRSFGAHPGVAERDVVDPLPLADRLSIAGRLVDRHGPNRAT
ncbi:MAG: GNAT family N-acetyltransferase [Candidatus Limnocylindrales bacterium]